MRKLFKSLSKTCFLIGFIGVCTFTDSTTASRCCSTTRGYCYYCDSTEECCSSNSYPCCDGGLSTGTIVGIVIAGIVFIVIIALVVFLCYRAQQRRQRRVNGVPHHHTATIQTIQTTQYHQYSQGRAPYPMGQGQQQGPYPPPPPAYYTANDPAFPPQ